MLDIVALFRNHACDYAIYLSQEHNANKCLRQRLLVKNDSKLHASNAMSDDDDRRCPLCDNCLTSSVIIFRTQTIAITSVATSIIKVPLWRLQRVKVSGETQTRFLNNS